MPHTKNDIRRLIADAKIANALDVLMEMLEYYAAQNPEDSSIDIYENLILTKSTFSQLEKDKNANTISAEQVSLTLGNIRRSTLSFLNQIDDSIFTTFAKKEKKPTDSKPPELTPNHPLLLSYVKKHADNVPETEWKALYEQLRQQWQALTEPELLAIYDQSLSEFKAALQQRKEAQQKLTEEARRFVEKHSPKHNSMQKIRFRVKLQQRYPMLTEAEILQTLKKEKADYELEQLTGKMVFVKGGTFLMGSEEIAEEEKPVHKVTVSDFYMAATQVTNRQFAAFIFEYGSDKVKSGEYKGQTMIEKHKWSFASTDPTGFQNPAGLINKGYENHPVINVTWYGANEFCKWLSDKNPGKTFRLPTEAEWEYAAGGGATRGHAPLQKWAGTNDENKLEKYAWYRKNSHDLGKNHKNYGTNPVGKKLPNVLDLYDMSGNVWEWCADWFDEKFYQKLVDSEEYKKNGSVFNPVCKNDFSGYRVLRGGSWVNDANNSRVAYRYGSIPYYWFNRNGFRVVVEL